MWHTKVLKPASVLARHRSVTARWAEFNQGFGQFGLITTTFSLWGVFPKGDATASICRFITWVYMLMQTFKGAGMIEARPFNIDV